MAKAVIGGRLWIDIWVQFGLALGREADAAEQSTPASGPTTERKPGIKSAAVVGL
jgi:hypothetical protein